MKELILTDRNQLDAVMLLLREMIESGGCKVRVTKLTKQRSIPQNSSLHLYLDNLATALHDAGIDQRVFLDKFDKDGFMVPVTPTFCKDFFRECAKIMYGKESTADLTTVEIQKVYQAVDMRIAEETGVQVDWPSDTTPMI